MLALDAKDTPMGDRLEVVWCRFLGPIGETACHVSALSPPASSQLDASLPL